MGRPVQAPQPCTQARVTARPGAGCQSPLLPMHTCCCSPYRGVDIRQPCQLQAVARPRTDGAEWSVMTGPYNLLHMLCAIFLGLVLGHYIQF